MAHILEGISKDKQFSSADVLENEITHLIADMYTTKQSLSSADGKLADTIEEWRKELVTIRQALHQILE